MVGQGFENHREIRVALAVAEDRGAAHAVQGFENDVTLLAGKLAQNVGAAADQGGRRQLREQGGEHLLVAVAQALRAIDHQAAGLLGLFQQVGGVDELVVEGRILAHQDHVQILQRLIDFRAELEPACSIIEYLQRTQACAGLAGALIEVLLFHVEQLPAAGLGGQQHGQRAVLLEADAGDGVHHDAQAN